MERSKITHLRDLYNKYKADPSEFETSEQISLLEAIPYLLDELEQYEEILEETEKRIDTLLAFSVAVTTTKS